MQSFIRGQRALISQLSSRTHRFEVLLTFRCAAIPVFDFVCFGLDDKNQLSDDRYMIFFNQRRAPDDSVTLDELQDQKARFAVDLDAIAPAIKRLIFTASPETAGRMSELAESFVTLREAAVEGADAVAEYRFSGADFGDEGSLLLAEIYRKGGQWRFGAIGQGFKGNLPALLQHFGGEILENQPSELATSSSESAIFPVESAIPPSNSATPAEESLIPPQKSAIPPGKSPIPPLKLPTLGELQRTLDSAPDGATISLPRGEYHGPILLARPLTLQGEGAVIWAQNGPVVGIQSAGVTLQGVQIEVTDAEPNLADADVALWVESGAPTLQNVRVRGRVVGLSGDENWNLPPFLDLGELAPRISNSWLVRLQTPVDCQLKIGVSGLQLVPHQLPAGGGEVQIVATGIGAETFLMGQIEVHSAGLVRAIPLWGRVGAVGAAPAQNRRLGVMGHEI